MAKICLCLIEKTLEKNLEILNKYRKYTDMAELRADCLDPDERLMIRRFPELAGLPVILTVRRDVDGGKFTSGEGARVKLLATGLSYAKADSRLNFAYVDLEDDFKVHSLEEAARTFGTRIIRSHHNLDGMIDDIPAKLKSMQHSGDEIVKIAMLAKSTKDIFRIYKASKELKGQDKILVGMGNYGMCTRILAEKFGSHLTYSSALAENTTAGPGQFDIREMSELYRFREINSETKIFGIAGYPLKKTISPWFFNTIFNAENINAVYVPFPTNSVTEVMQLARALDVQGLSVTVPHKESVIMELAEHSPYVRAIGACNTVYRTKQGWAGENTDAKGFSDSLLNFIKKENLKKKKITIIGAGGAARAVVSEIHRTGGKALVLNRTIHKARNIAAQYNFKWGGLDSQGVNMMSKYNDIIIQTTPLGMEGYEDVDPLELYRFSGDEIVMDLIYSPPKTHFLKRAESAGCKILNGYDMVIRQACLQYEKYIGKNISQQLLSRVSEENYNSNNYNYNNYNSI